MFNNLFVSRNMLYYFRSTEFVKIHVDIYIVIMFVVL